MIILKKDKMTTTQIEKQVKKSADFWGQCVVGFQSWGFLVSWVELDSEEM